MVNCRQVSAVADYQQLLEQLIGSQNLLGAVKTAFMLRQIGLTSSAIILLWGLSPLGGQSSLRVLGTKRADVVGSQFIPYFDTNATAESNFMGGSALGSANNGMSAIYQASLLAPENIQSSSNDLWGNVKIPTMEYLAGYDPVERSWVPVNHSHRISYSSLTGLMVAGLSPERKTKFRMQSSYFLIGCQEGQVFKTNDRSLSDERYGGLVDWIRPTGFRSNMSAGFGGGVPPNSNQTRWNSFFVDTNWQFGTGKMSDARASVINLLYVSIGDGIGPIAAFNCSILTTRVESAIICTGKSCHVDRMRHSVLDTRPPNLTPFNSDTISFIHNFLRYFPWAAGITHAGFISPTDLYLAGSDQPFAPNQNISTLAGVSAAQISRRLTTLVNTVWQASLATTSVATDMPANLTAVQAGDAGFTAANTTAITTVTLTLYSANRTWVSLTAAISLILFLCGGLGLFYKYAAAAPDILGYVSTMAGDVGDSAESWSGLERGTAWESMDGLDRARLLRDCNVQIVVRAGKGEEARGRVWLKMC